MTDLNLPALRKIAEGATQGEWRLAEWGAVIVTNNAKIGGDVRLFDVRGWGYLTGKGHGGLGMEPEDAIAQQTADGRHVATFDPPTVLRLLDRLDMAEKSYDQIQAQELADTEADRDAWKARAEAAEASLAQAVEMARREERERCSKEADDVAEISLSVVRDASFTLPERQKAQGGVRVARTIARLFRARAAQERTA